MKRFKGCLGVFLVFFFGFLFGCAITAGLAYQEMLELVKGGPEQITKKLVSRLNSDLKLDSDQQKMLEQIAMDTRIKLRTIRQSTQPEVDRTLSEAADRLRGILNTEQAEKFDHIIKKEQEKWKTRARPSKPASDSAEEKSQELSPSPQPKTETP